jgi:hypothetical protein
LAGLAGFWILDFGIWIGVAGRTRERRCEGGDGG